MLAGTVGNDSITVEFKKSYGSNCPYPYGNRVYYYFGTILQSKHIEGVWSLTNSKVGKENNKFKISPLSKKAWSHGHLSKLFYQIKLNFNRF